MIFGLNLPNYSSLGNRESMIAIAESAEELGYSSLWTSDHVLIPANRPETFSRHSPPSPTSRPALKPFGWELESWCSRSAIHSWSRSRPPRSIT